MRFLLAVSFLVLAPLGALTGGAAAEADGPDPLYLLPRIDDRYNFTTHAPEAGAADRVPVQTINSGAMYWFWHVNRLPESWQLQKGDQVETTIYFEGLDRVVPSPGGDPAQVGKLRVVAELLVATGRQSGIRTSWLDSFPVGNATGERFIDLPLLKGPGELGVTIPMQVHQDEDVDSRFSFALRIAVEGTTRADERPHIRIGSSDAPSHVVVAGFPVEAFRVWEAADLERKKQNEAILRGDDPRPDAGDDGDLDRVTGEASGAALGLLVVAVSLTLWSGRSRSPRVRR